MTFEIDDEVQKKLDEWIDKLPKKYQKMSTQYIFQGCSGIGYSIIARKGNKEIDLTDVSQW